MNESEYTVKRTIEDITFSETKVEEIREQVKHNMIDEGHDSLDPNEIEDRVKEKLKSIATDRTLSEQGHNRLHNSITHSLESE